MANTIIERFWELQDDAYGEFQKKLLPTVKPDTIIGVRTPALRSMAKELVRCGDPREVQAFLNRLPHTYFEENQLHAFLISEEKNFDSCMEKLEQFLPFVDNWATCDQMSPKILKKHRSELLESIRKWMGSDQTYTVRFAIGMLMQHFLEEDFSLEYPDLVAGIRSEEYYVNMMIAWYFATALAKQYDAVLPYLQNHRLDVWTHNKAIQKAMESYRITPEQKKFLRGLKR